MSKTKNYRKTKRPAAFDRNMRIHLGVVVSFVIILLVFLIGVLILRIILRATNMQEMY